MIATLQLLNTTAGNNGEVLTLSAAMLDCEIDRDRVEAALRHAE